MEVTLDFKELGLPESVRARDLWRGGEWQTFHKTLSVTLPRHGAVVFKISGDPSGPG